MTLPYQQWGVRGDTTQYSFFFSVSVFDPLGDYLRIPLLLLLNPPQPPSIIIRNMSVSLSLLVRENFGASLLYPYSSHFNSDW